MKYFRSNLRAASLVACLLVSLPARAATGDDILAREDLTAYHGWIKYLQFEAGVAAERFGADSPKIAERQARLEEWTQRILANPRVLSELRGVQEWAYLSPADGSGQPFQINIPTDYDPAQPAPVSIYLHGFAGNHLEHASGWPEQTEWFNLSVLGRARGGRYLGLSEADVRGVLDYVEAHWAIDPDRVHLNGGSMGGGGTFWLGARYPHRFATGRPTCGYALDRPLGNLLTLPLYATHSQDDPVVPVLASRGPLAWLRERGGLVVADETNGLGHAAWDYAAGNARSDAWFRGKLRPDSRTVRHIDYTAIDGIAMRGWWGEVVEWGPSARPARFVLRAGTANDVHAELFNVSRLALRIDESPIDPTKPLTLSVNGGIPFEVRAPVPARLVLAEGEAGWQVQTSAPVLPYRLHTPGGINQLFSGEPLLIVYGTGGDEATNAAMKAAAEVARGNASGAWTSPSGGEGVDGISHTQLLYGLLRTKADTEITAADLVGNHLILIGTAAQNAVVEALADRFPVTVGSDAITFSDGLKVPAAGAVTGLLHYHPDATDRLVFWVAAATADGYATDSPLTAIMAGQGGFPRNIGSGVDCLVLNQAQTQVVVARSFDSRWQWSSERATSPLLPVGGLSGTELADAKADALRRAVGADFGVASRSQDEVAQPYAPGLTRVSDLAAIDYAEPIGVITVTGERIREMQARLRGAPVSLRPVEAWRDVEDGRTYRIAVGSEELWAVMGATMAEVLDFQCTDLTTSDALERFLVTN